MHVKAKGWESKKKRTKLYRHRIRADRSPIRALSCFSPATTKSDTSLSDGIGICRISPSMPHASIYFTSNHEQRNNEIQRSRCLDSK